jgi:predicted nucleic acid-binding protein
MPEIISNTSPIQYLFQLGLLDLLPRLYGRVLVPPAVRDELDRGRMLGVDLPDLSDLEWIQIVDPETRVLLPLASGLGAGEVQVITLAKETTEHLALLDDRRARRFADLLGVTYTGTLGVLLRAKRKGLLERLEPVCGALEERGFRLSPATRRSVLSMAGE